MTNLRAVLVSIAIMAVLVAGCAGGAASQSPSPSPAPTAILTPEAALSRVISTEKRLTGITQRNVDLIGQASWYEVAPASGVGAFVVTVRVGWGDCPAGCINQHRWTFSVAPDGTVTVLSETGDPVPDDAWPGRPFAGRTGIGGTASAGPTCPVERVPPDPACAPHPVVGAVVVIRDASGSEIAQTTTRAGGTYFVEVPPGGYTVEPRPVKGLMGTPGPQPVSVNDGFASTVDLDYDTGIR